MRKTDRFDANAAKLAVQELRKVSVWLGVGYSFDPDHGFQLEVRVDERHASALIAKVPRSFEGFPVRTQILEGMTFN